MTVEECDSTNAICCVCDSCLTKTLTDFCGMDFRVVVCLFVSTYIK